MNNYLFHQLVNNFSKLSLCKINVFDIFNMVFFQIFVISRSSEIMIEPNFFLGIFVPYILKSFAKDVFTLIKYIKVVNSFLDEREELVLYGDVNEWNKKRKQKGGTRVFESRAFTPLDRSAYGKGAEVVDRSRYSRVYSERIPMERGKDGKGVRLLPGDPRGGDAAREAQPTGSDAKRYSGCSVNTFYP